MIDQQKILRVFKFIRFLSHKPYYTKKQLAERLEVSTKTIERYIELLEELGYIPEQDFEKRWFIQIESFPSEEGVSFSLEESELLHNLLYGSTQDHPLRDGIMRKLFIQSELRPLSANLLHADNAKKIRQLTEAINNKKQVILKNYHSANSQSHRDRKIEPLEFSENYESITAYELDSSQQKVFRIDRIGEVEILDNTQNYKKTAQSEDFFGWIGNEIIPIKLYLNDLAYRLLIEEYPATKPYTRLRDASHTYPYEFAGEVKHFTGVGRFVLSIPGDVLVIAPEGFREYLNGRVKGLKF